MSYTQPEQQGKAGYPPGYTDIPEASPMPHPPEECGVTQPFNPGFQQQPGFEPSGQPGFKPPGPPGFAPREQPDYGKQPGYGRQPGYGQQPQGYVQPGRGQQTRNSIQPLDHSQRRYSRQPPAYQNPISQQPGQMGGPLPPGGVQDGWMAAPPSTRNVPRGLEYLTMIDQLLVHQEVELLEIITGFETENTYNVKNSLGEKVFYAMEVSGCCVRNCCGPSRPFHMRIVDNLQTEVIHLYRPFKCDCCCCPCGLQIMEISAPPGTLIGTIEEEWSFCIPQFRIKNAAGDVVLRITGPCCTYSMCGNDVDFKVMSRDGRTQVGKISKQWAGAVLEWFTDADNFGITFPMDLDVRMKAVLLGACFLIDFMYYESSPDDNRRHRIHTL